MFWCNNFGWTYDPRKASHKRRPFVLFPVQASYLEGLGWCYQHRVRSLTEKTRDMGATWLNCAFDCHRFIFEPAYKAAVGSRKEDLVDRSEDPDAIFWKMRFLLSNVPGWMLADYESAHMRLSNPANGASITGEAGPNIGRGGRSSRYTVDEAAFLANPASAERALSENTDCLNETSTPNGPAGPFAERRNGDNAVQWAGTADTPTSAALVVFTLHWRDHPEKDDAWYERRKAAIVDPVAIAQELDIDYTASIRGIVIPLAWTQPCSGRALYERERGAICIGADIGEDGSDFSAAVVREGRNILHAEEWHGADPNESGRKIIALALEWEKKLGTGHKLHIFIDKVGIGSGTVATVRTYAQANRSDRWLVRPVQAGETAPEMTPPCHRMKDVLWWRARLWFQDQAPAIAASIAQSVRSKLTKELGSPTYRVNDAGLIVVESKKDMARRGVASPNLGDALIHTFLVGANKPPDPKPTGYRHEVREKPSGWAAGLAPRRSS